MRVIEREFTSGNYIGKVLAYADVEPELLEFTPRIRVLPARWYYEKRLWFELYRRYEVGENKGYPNGGFHVRDVNGAGYHFELDQVIVHPDIITGKKRQVKFARKLEKIKAQTVKQKKQAEREANGEKRRGRPALPEAERLKREAEKAERMTKSNGKRGRPPKNGVAAQPKEVHAYVPTGAKRGRPRKDLGDTNLPVKPVVDKPVSTGKRGRPANPERAKQREEEAARRLELNPTRRRGRPSR